MAGESIKGGGMRSLAERWRRLKELGGDFATRLLLMSVGLGGVGLTLSGGVWVLSYLFNDDISAGEAFPWLLAFLYGAACLAFVSLFVRDTNKAWQSVSAVRREASEDRRKAEENLRAEKRASEDSIAKVNRKHKSELTAVKEESKKALADMQKDIRKLQSEKGKVDKELSGVRQTLEYYSSRARLDVYADEESLRECGGIYVIKNTGDGKVKVGLTDENFKRRFGEIQSSCASAGIAKDDVQPVILAPLDEGKYEVEQAIHDALADNKTAGEWFKVTPEEAVATVLRHVYDMRVNNRKRRTKLPVGEVGGE